VLALKAGHGLLYGVVDFRSPWMWQDSPRCSGGQELWLPIRQDLLTRKHDWISWKCKSECHKKGI